MLPTTFLLCFCFILAIQAAHIDLSLITLFVIVDFLDHSTLYYYCTLNNKFTCFQLVRNIF